MGVWDNFFDLGGDSIMAIQIAAKVNQAGLSLSPNQLFQHPTITELVRETQTSSTILPEQGNIQGAIALTPMQHRFFSQNRQDPHHWNQTLLLEVPETLEVASLEKAVQQLLVHHDALRLQFTQVSSVWQQVNPASIPPIEVQWRDLSGQTDEEQDQAIAATEAQLQKSLNLAKGELVRVALFGLGPHRPKRLLMIIHHLVIDRVSWSIILEDLQTLCQPSSQGETQQLPLKTTSFKRWSEGLGESLNSQNWQSEREYWLKPSPSPSFQLPLDHDQGDNTEASTQTLSVSLTQAETRSLLQRVSTTGHPQVDELLLTALFLSLTQSTHPHSSSLQIDLESHDREETVVKGANLARTVGCLTSVFPVTLTVDDVSNPSVALKSIQEQLRHIPHRGIGYGILRYLSSEAKLTQKLETLSPSEIFVSYLGSLEKHLPQSSPFRLVREMTWSRSPREQRPYLLEIRVFIFQEQLRIHWRYNRNFHQETTLQQTANHCLEKLRSLIKNCLSSEQENHTPTDFPLAQLDEQKLSKLANLLRKNDQSS